MGGGEERWTDSVINCLTVYFGGAIPNFPGDMDEMHRAIGAVFHHSLSNDNQHDHQFCPSGSGSWCKYNRALADNEQPPKHTPKLPKDLSPFIEPVFTYLLGCPSGSCWKSVCWVILRIRMSPSTTSPGPGAPRLDSVLG